MSDTRASFGAVLRAIGGGPVEVMTREHDFTIRVVPNVGGGAGQELIAFQATQYREVGSTDFWAFDVEVETEGQVSHHTCYLHGSDIFMVRAPRRLTGG